MIHDCGTDLVHYQARFVDTPLLRLGAGTPRWLGVGYLRLHYIEKNETSQKKHGNCALLRTSPVLNRDEEVLDSLSKIIRATLLEHIIVCDYPKTL